MNKECMIYRAISNFQCLAGSGSHVPGTSEVNPKLVFPVEGLLRYLKEKHGIIGDGNNIPAWLQLVANTMFGVLSGSPLIRQFKHGQSNPTYYIEYGGAQLVLRKKPVGCKNATISPSSSVFFMFGSPGSCYHQHMQWNESTGE